jgi:hypothetical protein
MGARDPGGIETIDSRPVGGVACCGAGTPASGVRERGIGGRLALIGTAGLGPVGADDPELPIGAPLVAGAGT